MFERVTVHAADPGASARFYVMVLATLRIEPDGEGRWADFALAAAGGGRPVTRRLHIGFAARSRWWRATPPGEHVRMAFAGERAREERDPDRNVAELVIAPDELRLATPHLFDEFGLAPVL